MFFFFGRFLINGVLGGYSECIGFSGFCRILEILLVKIG